MPKISHQVKKFSHHVAIGDRESEPTVKQKIWYLIIPENNLITQHLNFFLFIAVFRLNKINKTKPCLSNFFIILAELKEIIEFCNYTNEK